MNCYRPDVSKWRYGGQQCCFGESTDWVKNKTCPNDLLLQFQTAVKNNWDFCTSLLCCVIETFEIWASLWFLPITMAMTSGLVILNWRKFWAFEAINAVIELCVLPTEETRVARRWKTKAVQELTAEVSHNSTLPWMIVTLRWLYWWISDDANQAI